MRKTTKHLLANAQRRVRLDERELEDLCMRHCELGETLTDEDIDKLIDTAWLAVDLTGDLALIEGRG